MINKVLNSLQSKKIQKPTVIQFPVNDICNSKCQMCNIWEQKKGKEISPQELALVLNDSLYSEVSGVGLNGGEPTLRKDLADLADVLFEQLPKLQFLSLITNGYVVKEVSKRIDELAETVHKHNGFLDVMLSLDGVGEVHDKIRRRDNFFNNTYQVLQYVKKHQGVNNVRIGYTISKDNVYGLHDMLDFAIREGVYVKFRMGVTHERLYHDQRQNKVLSLTNEEKYHIATFLSYVKNNYEQNPNQKYFYESLIGQLIYNQPRKAACDWQNRGATLLSNGDFAYCATESPILGNLLEKGGSSHDLYFNSIDILNTIKKDKCDSCMHDYMGPLPISLRIQAKLKGKAKLVKKVIPHQVISETLFRIYKRNIDRQLLRENSDTKSFDDSSKGNVKKILVCGWYGTETLGDQAILAGIDMAINSCDFPYVLDVVSLDMIISERTKRDFDFLNESNNYTIEEAYNRIPDYDYLLFGGGPLMAINEIYPMYRLFEKAKQYNLVTIVAGCGVGPLGSRNLNKYIKRILKISDKVIYRDSGSFQRAKRMGVDTKEHRVSEDPSMTFLTDYFSSVSRTEIKEPFDSNKIKVLLALRDWPYIEYAYGLISEEKALEINNDYKSKIQQIIFSIAENYNVEFFPLPMCVNMHGGDDRFFYRELINEMPQEIKDKFNQELLTKEIKPQDYINYYMKVDFGITMRFHSVVFGICASLPMFAIDYTLGNGKVTDLLNKYKLLKGDNISDFRVEDVMMTMKELMGNKVDYRLNLDFSDNMKICFSESSNS